MLLCTFCNDATLSASNLWVKSSTFAQGPFHSLPGHTFSHAWGGAHLWSITMLPVSQQTVDMASVKMPAALRQLLSNSLALALASSGLTWDAGVNLHFRHQLSSPTFVTNITITVPSFKINKPETEVRRGKEISFRFLSLQIVTRFDTFRVCALSGYLGHLIWWTKKRCEVAAKMVIGKPSKIQKPSSKPSNIN